MLEEDRFDAQIIEGLKARGHNVVERSLTSGVHGFVVRQDGSYDGGADSRREGEWLAGPVEAAEG